MGLIGGGAVGGSLITPASRGGGIPVGSTIEGATFAAFAADATGGQGNPASGWPAYRGANPTLTEPPILATVAGQVALSFGSTGGGAARIVTLPGALGTACVTAGSAEIFLILRATGSSSGIWVMGGSGGADSWYPLAGSVYDGAFSTARKPPWVPGAGIISNLHCLHVLSINGLHETRLNGSVVATTATNTFNATGVLSLGMSGRSFFGEVFGVVVFAGIGADSTARNARRLQVQSQLTTRYGLTFTG